MVDTWDGGRLPFSCWTWWSQHGPRQSWEGAVLFCPELADPQPPPSPVALGHGPRCTVQPGATIEAQCSAPAGWSLEASVVSHPVAGWPYGGLQPQPCCPWKPLGGSKDHPWLGLLPQSAGGGRWGGCWSPGAGGADPLGPQGRWQWGSWSVPPAPLLQALWWLLLHPSQC